MAASPWATLMSSPQSPNSAWDLLLSEGRVASSTASSSAASDEVEPTLSDYDRFAGAELISSPSLSRKTSKEQCDALVGRVAAASLPAGEATERSREPSGGGGGGDSALDSVVEELGRHAPSAHVTELTETLTRCFELGDGCVVAAQRPPRLEGSVPRHLRRVWGRVPELVESGHLRYEAARDEQEAKS